MKRPRHRVLGGRGKTGHRRQAAILLRAAGWSYNLIAEVLGVNQKTAYQYINDNRGKEDMEELGNTEPMQIAQYQEELAAAHTEIERLRAEIEGKESEFGSPKTSMDMGVIDGQVVIQFGSRIAEVRFTPEQAYDIGMAMIAHSKEQGDAIEVESDARQDGA